MRGDARVRRGSAHTSFQAELPPPPGPRGSLLYHTFTSGVPEPGAVPAFGVNLQINKTQVNVDVRVKGSDHTAKQPGRTSFTVILCVRVL